MREAGLSAILGWIADLSPGLAPPRGTLASVQCAEWLGWFTSAAHDYLVDGRYSVADCNALVFYRWATRVGFDVRRDFPAWTRHAERLVRRPAVGAAVQVEEIEIWSRPGPAR